MMIPFLQKQHVRRFDGWTIWKRWIQVKKRRPRTFWDINGYDFRRQMSLDLVDKYLCQFIQGIFFRFSIPQEFFPFLQAPPPPHPSVLSSSYRPVTAQLTLHNEKSKIKILLGDRIVSTNKQWQKRKKQAVAILQVILNKERDFLESIFKNFNFWLSI